MRIFGILVIGYMLLAFAGVAHAAPFTSFGQPVVGIGSSTAAVPNCPTMEGISCFNTGTGNFDFYIPLSAAYSGNFGDTLVPGGTAGTVLDTGSGTGLNADPPALRMFLRFSPVAVPASSASLTFNFVDLDLAGVNDPNY